MPEPKLFPFVYCPDCREIVSHKLDWPMGVQRAQPVRCQKCGTTIVMFYKRGEQVKCNNNDEVVPTVIDLMPATNGNEHRAQDVVCPKCFSIIATFHETRGRPNVAKIEVAGRN